jgi:hypothetical protein
MNKGNKGNDTSTVLSNTARTLKAAVPVALIALFAASSHAATPSNASLKGSYNFHIASAKEAYWSNSKACTYKGNTQTYWADSWSAYTEIIYGVATFDGAGHVNVTFTQMGEVNQSASNDSIVITCEGNGYSSNGGNLVFETPAGGTAAGTYSIASTGSGSMTISIVSCPTCGAGGGSLTIDMDLGVFGSNGVASMALLRDEDGDQTKHPGAGVAILK